MSLDWSCSFRSNLTIVFFLRWPVVGAVLDPQDLLGETLLNDRIQSWPAGDPPFRPLTTVSLTSTGTGRCWAGRRTIGTWGSAGLDWRCPCTWWRTPGCPRPTWSRSCPFHSIFSVFRQCPILVSRFRPNTPGWSCAVHWYSGRRFAAKWASL